MEWTFGIVTSSLSGEFLEQQTSSIARLGLSRYEIIVIGGEEYSGKNIKHLAFDETKQVGWVTRKKNLLAHAASFENLVVCHDYFRFHEDWAAGFEIFGKDWNVALNRIKDIKGRRFYDWTYWDSESHPKYSAVPYDVTDQTSKQFVPGAYFCTKTDFLLNNPFDESLSWGQSEDVEWSLRIRDKGMVFNPFSSAQHLKKHRGYKFWRSIYPSTIELYPKKDSTNWTAL